MKLIDLLTKIRDSDIWCPTKDDYNNRGIREPMKLAHAYDLIEEYGGRGGNCRLTKDGYKVIEANGDLSILEKPDFSIQSTNTHVGDNYGEYNQSSSKDIKTKNPPTKAENNTIKRVLISLTITVIGRIIYRLGIRQYGGYGA